jgi:hypothetical protein
MSPTQRYAKKQAKASKRRRYTAQERFARDRRQAQQAAKALQQALDDLGLPEDLVTEIERRLRTNMANTSWLIVSFGECQLMASLITRGSPVSPLVDKGFQMCHPRLARRH